MQEKDESGAENKNADGMWKTQFEARWNISTAHEKIAEANGGWKIAYACQLLR